MFKQTYITGDSSDSDDVSITSTVASDVAEDQIYLVENVLAKKRREDGDWVFLVKWEGYPIERCSWEPIEMFNDPSMVNDWRPDSNPFDWRQWDADREKEEEEREQRRCKRQEKRKRLGLVQSPPISARKLKISTKEISEDEEDDIPAVRRGKLRRRNMKKSAREEIDDLADDSSSESDSSKDSMMEDLRRIHERKHTLVKGAQPPPERKLKLQESKKRVRSISPIKEQTSRVGQKKPQMNLKPQAQQKRLQPEPAPIQSTKKPPNYGTARRTKLQVTSKFRQGDQQLYDKLSIRHRANKWGAKERTPDVTQVSLFRPGEMLGRARLPPRVNSESSGFGGITIAAREPSPTEGATLAASTTTVTPAGPAWKAVSPSITTRPTAMPTYEYFETVVEYGPPNQVKCIEGKVKFTGFTSDFLSMVAGSVPRIRIAYSLENAYLSKYFVPEMGPPLEFADMEVDTYKCEPLVDALAILHGAGVVLHSSFTLLIFQPSNDTLRNAFKTPQQRKRTALRAIAYPPLTVKRPPSQAEAVVLRAPYDDGFRMYLPNLMYRTLGLNLQQIFSGAGKKWAYIYSHEAAFSERIELATAIQMMKIPVIPVKLSDIRKRIAEWKKQKIYNFVFVHYSLQDKLHLLPGIEIFQSAQGVQFHFFGHIFDAATSSLKTCPSSQFWKFGTYILLTPHFVLESAARGLQFLAMIDRYQQQKAGSTGILIPSTLVDRVQNHFIDDLNHPHRKILEENLRLVYSLAERAKKKIADPFSQAFGVRVLAIDVEVDVTDEHEEFEVMVDRLIFFQRENLDIRKLTVATMLEKARLEPLMEIYGSIEFLDVDGLKRFQMSPPPTDARKKD